MADNISKGLYQIQKIACDPNYQIYFDTDSPWANRMMSRGITTYDFGETHAEMVTGYGFGQVVAVDANKVTLHNINGVLVGYILVNVKSGIQQPISAVTAGNKVTVTDGTKFVEGDSYLVMQAGKEETAGNEDSVMGLSRNVSNAMQIFTKNASFSRTRITQAESMMINFGIDKRSMDLPREIESVLRQMTQDIIRSATYGVGSNTSGGKTTMKGWMSYFDNTENGLPRSIVKTASATIPIEEITGGMDEAILLAKRQGFDFNGATFQVPYAWFNLLQTSKKFKAIDSNTDVGRTIQSYISMGYSIPIEPSLELEGKSEAVLWNDKDFSMYRFGDEYYEGIDQGNTGLVRKVMFNSQVTVIFRGIASAVRIQLVQTP